MLKRILDDPTRFINNFFYLFNNDIKWHHVHGERGAGKKEDEGSFPWIMLFPCLTIRFDVGPMYGLN